MKGGRKAEKRGRCAAREVEKRYVVEWKCKDGEITSRTLSNLARARGYAKEFRKIAQKYIDSGSDEDGSMAATVKSITIYEATLRPVEI